jgi:hypothetical protein
MGGTDYREVIGVKHADGFVHITSQWGLHVPVAGTMTDPFKPDEKLRIEDRKEDLDGKGR